MTKALIPAVVKTVDGIHDDPDVTVLYNNTHSRQTVDGEISVERRPTFDTLVDNSTSGSRGRGMYDFGVAGAQPLHVVNDTYYYIGGNTDVSGPTGSDNFKKVAFATASDAQVPTLVLSVPGDGTSQYGSTWTGTSSTSGLTRITHSDIPGNSGTYGSLVRGVVALDGRVFLCNDEAKIYQSAEEDPHTWNSNNFQVAERVMDTPVYLGLHREHLVYFGTESIEFFYNSGAETGSVLQRRQEMYHNVGCAYPNSIQEIGDVIYFVGRAPNGPLRLYKLENFRLKTISNVFIDRVLNFVYYPVHSLGHMLHPDGTIQLVLNIATATTFNSSTATEYVSYSYNTMTKEWSHWFAGGTPTNATINGSWTTFGSLPITDATIRFVQFEHGEVASINPDGSLDDLGLTAASSYYYTNPVDMKTNDRKRVEAIRVLHYPQANSSDTGGTINVSWIDTEDTFAGGIVEANFPTGRTINVDSMTARTYRCGTMRQRIHKVTLNANRIVKGLELDFTQLRG